MNVEKGHPLQVSEGFTKLSEQVAKKRGQNSLEILAQDARFYIDLTDQLMGAVKRISELTIKRNLETIEKAKAFQSDRLFTEQERDELINDAEKDIVDISQIMRAVTTGILEVKQ